MALDLPQLPTPQTGTRNLQLESGDPFALLRVGQQQAQSVAESTPEQKFGYALLQLLQQHQQLDTAPFVRQELNARDAQIKASNAALTNPSLQGYAPSTIFSSGRAAEAPYNPTIRGAQEGAQTFEGQLRGFAEGIKNVKDYLNQVQQEQNRQRDDARTVIQNALTTVGGDAFHDLDSNQVSQLEKQAGYPKGYLSGITKTLKDRELQLRRDIATGKGEIPPGATPETMGLVNPETGKAEGILSGVDAGTAQIVKQLTDYKIPLPSGFALRSPYWQRILGLATQYDPSFDATQYNVRLKLKQDFTSGKSAQNIRSLNTVLGHLDTLKGKSDALANSSFRIWNQIKNRGLIETGDKRVVEFNNAANAVENELANVFKNMGATDQEIKAWRANLNAAQSPQQLRGAINTALELISSRMQALQSQYETGLGKPKDFHFLNNRSRQILKNLGQNPDSWDSVGSMIRVREKTTGRTGNIPSGEFDANKYDRVSPTSMNFGSPLAQANNNPGNLRFAGQTGATAGQGGFARFETPEVGTTALEGQIALDASRGHTLASFINKYAPPSENDTQTYIRQAMQNLGVAANTPLRNIDRGKLARFIALKESNSRI